MSDNILLPTSEPDVASERRPHRPARLGLALIGSVLAAAWTLWPAAGTEDPADALPVPEPFSAPLGEWIEAAFPDLDGGFTAIAERDGRLTAVGTGLRVDSPPFAFSSPDGTTWERSDGPWERGELILDVTSHEDGFLAVGHGFDLETLSGTGLRLWASADGRSWHRRSTVGFSDDAVVTQIAFTEGRFMAIGYEGEAPIDPGFPQGSASSGRVWTSTDAETWIDDTPESIQPAFNSLIASDTGGFVIGGVAEQRPTVWRHDDGWSASANPLDEYRSIGVTAVVERADDLIVMSQLDPPESPVFLWAIDEEGEWTGLFGETQRPQSTRWITVVDGDLYAGPPFSRAVFTTGPELWVSDRGRDWFGVEITRGVSPWPPAAVSTLIETDRRLVAFGSRGGSPTLWTLQSG